MLYKFPIFISEVARYEIRGDNMHIVWPNLELVLPVRVMLGSLAEAKAELEAWCARNAEVVPFPEGRCA